MSDRNLSLALRLYTDSARFVSGLTQASSGVRGFASGARAELASLSTAAGSVQGQLAQLGLSVSAVALAVQSARMDKSLTQIGQTAGMSSDQVRQLRKELFTMAGDTGQQVDDLQTGFNNAVQAGLGFDEALPVLNATNKAVAVTSASANKLTGSLTVAATAFDFDLARPGQALLLLDKMTAAGRLGNAELENLSDIFARVGVNASSAGMGFDKTLGFIEALSMVERAPERLATLADSTLRIFTNAKYMQDANKATGVKFFDAKGERRDALDVLADIKRQYDKLTTDKDRARFVSEAFGHADLDTIKGLRTLLGGDMLGKVRQFSGEISNAGGTLERDLPAAISNAVDQTGRLKARLREAADDFAKPINDALQNAIKFGLDKQANGGLELSGEGMVAGGAVGALGLFAAARYGGKGISALAGRFGSTAAGVAEGKVLEQAAGVTPVFVVNMPAGGLGGAASAAADAAGAAGAAASAAPAVVKVASKARTLAVLAGGLPLSTWGSMGAAGLGTAAAGVTAAGALGYGLGTLLSKTLIDGTAVGDKIGESVARVLALFGSEEAQRAIDMNQPPADGTATRPQISRGLGAARTIEQDRKTKPAEVGGEIRIRIDQAGVVQRVQARTDNAAVPFQVGYAGRTMVVS